MLVPPETPLDVPLYVIFALASGVPLVGRTFIPDHVKTDNLLLLLAVLMVTVMVVVVGVTIPDASTASEPDPLPLTATDTELAVVSNWNPDGAFRIIVPAGIPVVFDSVIMGPVKVV
jgi:hypothetical protein